MADIWSKEKRSEVMSKVRSKNNKSTELLLIVQFKYLHITGWRRNYKVKGKPDFVFLKQKVAVFADGCFWHGHNCRIFHPKTNEEYWMNKIEKNRSHDREVNSHLEKLGWTVVRVWECEIKKGIAIIKIVDALRMSEDLNEIQDEHYWMIDDYFSDFNDDQEEYDNIE